MKIPWLSKNKPDRPKFWEDYINSFKNPKTKSIEETRFVVFDTETTGFDFKNDRILSIGAVAINNGVIDIADGIEIYIKQRVFKEDTVQIHGILKEGKLAKIDEEEAIERCLDYIGNAILVAHHASFDRNMINAALDRKGLGKLKNRMLDTGILYKKTKHFTSIIDRNKIYSLDQLCQELNISTKDRHTASGDAFITAIAFLKILAKLNSDNKLTVKELFRLSRFQYR